MKFKFSALKSTVLTLSMLIAAPQAQAELILPKASPLASVSQRIGVSDVAVEYSSPGVSGRKIFGGLVPYGNLWRTGANACTKITFSTDAEVAGRVVPAGSYCLSTVPGETSWELTLNKNTELWGVADYDEKDEVLRVSLKPETADKTERLTFAFSDVKADSAVLKLSWDTVAVPITIKVETKELALANIEALKKGTWREFADAASYLQTEVKDLDKAMAYVEKSISESETWYNTWLKASIQADKGNKEDALALAKKAKSMGDDSNFFAFFAPRIDKALSDWQ